MCLLLHTGVNAAMGKPLGKVPSQVTGKVNFTTLSLLIPVNQNRVKMFNVIIVSILCHC